MITTEKIHLILNSFNKLSLSYLAMMLGLTEENAAEVKPGTVWNNQISLEKFSPR